MCREKVGVRKERWNVMGKDKGKGWEGRGVNKEVGRGQVVSQ